MITREGAEGQVQEFLNGRKTLQDALEMCVLRRDCMKSGRIQRRFVETDSLQVLEDWFYSLGEPLKEEHFSIERAQNQFQSISCFKATIKMPPGQGVSSEVSGEVRSSREKAKQSAAYNACCALNDLGKLKHIRGYKPRPHLPPLCCGC